MKTIAMSKNFRSTRAGWVRRAKELLILACALASFLAIKLHLIICIVCCLLLGQSSHTLEIVSKVMVLVQKKSYKNLDFNLANTIPSTTKQPRTFQQCVANRQINLFILCLESLVSECRVRRNRVRKINVLIIALLPIARLFYSSVQIKRQVEV